MKIDISQISKVDGSSLDLDLSENLEDLSSAINGVDLTKPVSFKGKLTNISGILKLDGHIHIEYSAKCSRCLKDLDSQMSIKVQDSFVNGDKLTDGDSYTYEGNRVSIDKALKDNIVLNLPVRQLCKDECRGLCSNCGSDLNVKQCECKEGQINPQMEALKNFFKD